MYPLRTGDGSRKEMSEMGERGGVHDEKSRRRRRRRRRLSKGRCARPRGWHSPCGRCLLSAALSVSASATASPSRQSATTNARESVEPPTAALPWRVAARRGHTPRGMRRCRSPAVSQSVPHAVACARVAAAARASIENL